MRAKKNANLEWLDTIILEKVSGETTGKGWSSRKSFPWVERGGEASLHGRPTGTSEIANTANLKTLDFTMVSFLVIMNGILLGSV